MSGLSPAEQCTSTPQANKQSEQGRGRAGQGERGSKDPQGPGRQAGARGPKQGQASTAARRQRPVPVEVYIIALETHGPNAPSAKEVTSGSSANEWGVGSELGHATAPTPPATAAHGECQRLSERSKKRDKHMLPHDASITKVQPSRGWGPSWAKPQRPRPRRRRHTASASDGRKKMPSRVVANATNPLKKNTHTFFSGIVAFWRASSD